MLDVSTRLIVIIGGGAVAARKAQGLLDAGATRVRIVACELSSGLPTTVELIRAAYHPDHLTGASLVFAATNNPDVNAQIVRDAHARSLLVCRADSDDDDAPGDFATPAQLKRGQITVTVSASGNPALAAAVRNGMAQRWDNRWSDMAAAMQTLRPLVLAAPGLATPQRAEIFRTLATDDALAVLATDGFDALKRWLIERHPQLSYTS